MSAFVIVFIHGLLTFSPLHRIITCLDEFLTAGSTDNSFLENIISAGLALVSCLGVFRSSKSAKYLPLPILQIFPSRISQDLLRILPFHSLVDGLAMK